MTRPTLEAHLPAQIRRWNNLLNSRFPLVGAWLQDHAVQNLCAAARQGSSQAAKILADAAARHPQPEIRRGCVLAVAKDLPASSVEGLWESWAETRSEEIFRLIQSYPWLPARRSDISLLACLKLGRMQAARNIGREELTKLLNYRFDRDETVSRAADEALKSLKRQTTINALCALWAQSRQPDLEKMIQGRYIAQSPPHLLVLTALKSARTELVVSGNETVILPLIAALSDPDPEIARRAVACLRGLTNQDAVNELCRQWVLSGDDRLEAVIRQSRYLPSRPRTHKFLIALLTDRNEIVHHADPEDVSFLLSLTSHPNPIISSNVDRALHHLLKPASKAALCSLVIKEGDTRAAQICLESGYLPEKPEEQALFHFYAENWQELESLDSRHSMLRAAYIAADASERRRMADWIQRSGKTNLLDVLNPAIQFLTDQSEQDQTYLASLLLGNRAYEQAFELALHCSPELSANIILRLNESGYRPEPANQRAFAQLLGTARTLCPLNDAVRQVPLALPAAVLSANGRVNSLSFSPCSSQLAVGSSQKLVVLWDYQRGEPQQVIRGFKHAVGPTVFGENGELWIGERGRNGFDFGLYRWSNRLEKTAALPASVLNIEPENHGVWVTSRDAALIHLEARSAAEQINLSSWARAVAFSPDRQAIAACDRTILFIQRGHPGAYRRIQIVNQQNSVVRAGIISAAVFSADSQSLVIGQHNGQILRLDRPLDQRRIKVTLTAAAAGKITALVRDRQRGLIWTASYGGQIGILSPQKDNFATTGLRTGKSGLTAINLDPMGRFLAAGYANNQWDLWDVRSQDLPVLFRSAIGTISPAGVETIFCLEENPLLPAAVRGWLTYTGLLLRHRFQYDIDIASLPAIKPGNHEIILEENG